MAVKRNYKEVYELLENLVMVGGAKEVLNEIYNVMDKEKLADVLEDVADNWDIEVNEDGSVEWQTNSEIRGKPHGAAPLPT